MGKSSETRSATATSDTPEPSPSQRQIKLEDSDAFSTYANFCRVTGTPEELIVDFGLNSQPFGTPTEPVKITQRLVINYFTAKRLLHALHQSVYRYEQAFGVLKTNVQNRMIISPRLAQMAAGSG